MYMYIFIYIYGYKEHVYIYIYTHMHKHTHIHGAALLGPPSPPHPMVSPLPPVVPCGVGSPLPLPTVVAVGCAPFHGYCWLGVWRPVAKGFDLRM